MKVFVVGANGQIGRQLTALLTEDKEHTVRAMVRNEDQSELFRKLGTETAIVDLEGDVKSIAKAAQGCQAIVFTAGSGGHTGAEKTLLVDLDGAVKTMEAAEQAGIKRFVMVSALQAHNREHWAHSIKPYYAAKHYADQILTSMQLNYTIVRPGALTNEPSTGKVTVAENLSRASIPRADVAAVIVAVLESPNAYRRAFDLTSGDMEIVEAIKML